MVLFRNQAHRVATIIWQDAKHTVVGYAMPNGAYYFNTIVDTNNTYEYKAITFEALADKASESQLVVLAETIADHLDELKQEAGESRKKEWRLRHAVATCERRLNYLLTNNS